LNTVGLSYGADKQVEMGTDRLLASVKVDFW